MKDFHKKHPIYFTCIAIAAIFIFALFFVAGCNHYYVNEESQINIENLSVNFENTKADIEVLINNTSHKIQEKETESIFKELYLLLIDIEKAKNEIVKQYRTIFDANTITFLVTFLSALFFTLFLTYIVYNVQQYWTLKSMNEKLHNKIAKINTQIKEVDAKIKEANDRIAEADTKITEVDAKIAEAEKDWNTKLQYQEYLLKVATERNSLTQVLNLVSVLGSQLASSSYIIKPEYTTLVYMIRRKTQLILKEGFKDIKDIRSEERTEFMQIITDCITYLNIETLADENTEGLTIFTQLDNDLKDIQDKIKKISVSDEFRTSEPSAMALD